jgi:hypothetical protein
VSDRRDRILLAGFALAMITVIWGEISRRPAVIDDAAWRAAATTLKKVIRPGDTLLLHNAGSSAGLETLQQAGLSPRLALPEPRGRVRRLWLVGSRPRPPAGLGFLRRAKAPVTLGQGLHLQRFERPEGGILWRAVDELSSAAVSAAGKRCKGSKNGGWRCDHLPDWVYVAPIEQRVAGALRHCLWAHPPSADRPLSIHFKNLPRGTLTVHHGLSEKAARSDNTAPVRLQLTWADGGAEVKVGNRDGWRQHRFKVHGDLTLLVRAKRDGQRHYCFSAVLR